MGEMYSQTTQSEEMEGVDRSQGINVESGAEPGLRTMICWWGNGCLGRRQPTASYAHLLDEKTSLVQEQFTLLFLSEKTPWLERSKE